MPMWSLNPNGLMGSRISQDDWALAFTQLSFERSGRRGGSAHTRFLHIAAHACELASSVAMLRKGETALHYQRQMKIEGNFPRKSHRNAN